MGIIGTKKFKRYLQYDSYSCGPKATYAITKHFGVATTYKKTFEALGCTPKDGVSEEPIILFLLKRGLAIHYRENLRIKELRHALRNGAVLLVYIDDCHYSIVHAMSDKYVYMADPSKKRIPGPRITLKEFKRRWSKWAVAVAHPQRLVLTRGQLGVLGLRHLLRRGLKALFPNDP